MQYSELLRRIAQDWDGLVNVVNLNTAEVHRLRGVLTEILTHSGDIPSLYVLLPAKRSVMSRLRSPWKAVFSHEMRLFAVCPVTLRVCGEGWEV